MSMTGLLWRNDRCVRYINQAAIQIIMKGKIVYCLIYAVSKEVKKAKDEIVKPVKSSPNYEEYFPRFKVLENAVVQEVKGRKITFDLKTFSDTNLIVEAETEFDLKTTQGILDIKNLMYQESKKIASKYGPSPFFEEYMFFVVNDFNNVDSYVDENKDKIASLLKDEPIELVRKEIEDTISNNIKYGKEDIAIIEWDGAFLLDKKGDFKDIISIIELANIQLLNLRILDNKLQDEITRLKDNVGAGGILSLFRLSNFMKDIIKRRTQSTIEFGNIDNSIKLYGDWYSAKLYDLASRKFYLEKWKTDVEKKLSVLKDLYEMVAHSLTEKYNLFLEFTITVLILFEIGMAFFR